MSPVFLHEIYGNAVNTLIALIVLAITYVIVNILAAKKTDSHRQRRRFRIRTFYLFSVVMLFVLARIWVEGFTHLLAVLGLVSAALVVTNKETIMNLVGWLIITWRDIFSEEDLIQIQQYKGYVKHMGLLYFVLAEISETSGVEVTGRLTRIPNGFVTNNPIINFSQVSHLLEQTFSVVVPLESDFQYVMHFIQSGVDSVLREFYNAKVEYSIEYLKKRNKKFADQIYLHAKTVLVSAVDKPAGVELRTRYYCFSNDIPTLRQDIWLHLLSAVQQDKKVEFLSAH